MNDISLLNNDKEKYNEMKDALNRVIQYLNDAIDNLESASSTISSNNIVNDVRADGDKVNLYKNNLTNQVNWLKNTILPAIDNSISECNSQIDNLMSAIVATSTLVAPTVQVGSSSVVKQAESSKTTISNQKINITKLANNKKITTNTSVSKMLAKTKVKSSAVNKIKKTTKVSSILGRLFR